MLNKRGGFMATRAAAAAAAKWSNLNALIILMHF